MSDELIDYFCRRLQISDVTTKEKSKEILRLVNIKNFGAVNETVKVIISIDCATNLCNTEINHDDALMLCKMKKTEYTRQKEIVEKLLNLKKKVTLDEICTRLEISCSIKQTAFLLLNEYKKRNTFSTDINDVQFLAMAIHQSCKMKKYKSSNLTKLIQISRLNGKMWKKLEEDWNSWINDTMVPKQMKVASNTSDNEFKTKDSHEYVAETNDDNYNQPYEVWRASMIELAKENL